MEKDGGLDNLGEKSSNNPEKTGKALGVDDNLSCKLIGNFIKLNFNEKKTIFEYVVTFDPWMEDTRTRKKLIRQFPEVLGKSPTFDGNQAVFLPFMLKDKITSLVGRNPHDFSESVTISLKLRQCVRIGEEKPFYNALFYQFFEILGLRQVNDKFYDFTTKFRMPDYKLYLRPGITSFVRYTDNGLMIGLNIGHLVRREPTLYDALDDMRDLPDYKEKYFDFTVGNSLVASYNNICYEINDIAWNMNPDSTFKCGSKLMTYTEYFRLQYGIKIRYKDQPLLLSRSRFRIKTPTFAAEPGSVKLLPLIPELCFLAGITGSSRTKKTTKTTLEEMRKYTMYTPAHRINTLRQFMTLLKNNPNCVELLHLWGLEIADDFVEMKGHVILGPTIQFNSDVVLPHAPTEFMDISVSFPCYNPVTIKKWLVFCIPSDKKAVIRMLESYKLVANTLGIKITLEAKIIEVHMKPGSKSKPEAFRAAIVNNVRAEEVQFVIVVLPEFNDEVYSVVKVLTLMDIGVPSQVILAHKIRDDRRVLAMMQRVVPQINCKLGGSLWALRVPTEEALMFVGMDAFHDQRKFRQSVHGMVASLNSECTRYYSRATVQPHNQEVCYSLKPLFIAALLAYREENHKLPDRIIIFRDGITVSQFECILEYEVLPMLEAARSFGGIPPKFCYMVVQKRILERFFLSSKSMINNPMFGSVVDNTITRPNMNDFFLVSQSMDQGTVRPTHYIILEDCGENNPRLFQKFAHATAFMYYNWPSSIRIPAMCQYAHKIASLVGNTLLDEPKEGMENKLYYL